MDEEIELLEDVEEGEQSLLERRRTAAEHRARKNLDRDLPDVDDEGELVEDDD